MERYNSEENGLFDLNEPSNYTAAVSDFVSGHYTAPTASFSPSRQFDRASRTVSDFIGSVTNTGVIPLERHPRSSFQAQNLWNAPTTLLIDPIESALLIDPIELALLIDPIESREPGHRDNPIVIEDDEEDYAQHNGIFYEEDMSYEALLSLQEHIGGVGTGLKKNVISQLLKQRKYQSTKMKNCSDSCSICLATYDDNEELGEIDCGHEFHYQCISKWLKINNSCPICRSIALNP